MQTPVLPRTWHTVNNLEAAETLTQPRKLHYLMPFIGQERTVAEVARVLEITPHRMLYQVRRLVRLELLEVVREVTRAGRAIRWYRAVADGFFVPFALTDAQTPEQLAQRLMDESRQLLERQVGRAWMTAGSDLGSWGINVYCTPEGQVNTSLVPAPTPAVPRAFFEVLLEAAAPAVWDTSFTLALARDDAKALQRELSALAERYRQRERPGSPTHLIRLAMAPLDR